MWKNRSRNSLLLAEVEDFFGSDGRAVAVPVVVIQRGARCGDIAIGTDLLKEWRDREKQKRLLFFGGPVDCGTVGRERDIDKFLGTLVFVFPKVAEGVLRALEA